jgi:hypothetical protein
VLASAFAATFWMEGWKILKSRRTAGDRTGEASPADQ